MGVSSAETGRGAVVCRPRPRRNPRRNGRAARRRRGAPERALRRDQPRHRAPGAQRPGSRERACPHARAQHGGRLSVSGEIRLRDRRAASNPDRPISSAASASRSIPTRRRSICRRRQWRCCRRTCRRRAACSPPTWRRRSTRSGTRARAGRPHRRRRRRGGGLAVRVAVRQAARRRGHAGRHRPAPGRNRSRARGRLRAAVRCAPAIATSSSMRAPPQPGSRRRCGSPATRRPSSS